MFRKKGHLSLYQRSLSSKLVLGSCGGTGVGICPITLRTLVGPQATWNSSRIYGFM